jgi:hypothetical protein
MFAPDTDDTLQVSLLGNRVDRFVWNGSALIFGQARAKRSSDHAIPDLYLHADGSAGVHPVLGAE